MSASAASAESTRCARAGKTTLELLASLMRPPYRGAHRRLSRQLRTAHMLASDEEATDLERVRLLVKAEMLDVHDAQELLRGVLRGMHERQTA